MADDLFAAAAAERLSARAPLADRLRPTTLDEVVGQEHLLGPKAPLRRLIEADRLSSAILFGPAGTGKTTLARLVARTTEKEFASLSAVDASVKDVREVIARSRQRLGERGQGTILFLDEVHRFSKSQQDALLPAVEEGLIVLIGATTENPYFTVNPPLLSRSTLFRLEPLGPDALRELVGRGLTAEGAEADEDAIDHLVLRAGGDGRQTLTALEVAVALAGSRDRSPGDPIEVTAGDMEAALGVNTMRYGRDEHYDVISAFIKSIRGSDPDAGLWWLATMLEAGEDARFIARRLVILASEDIGMADPMALLVAEAASRAVDHVGLPEAQLNLAQAVVHLATAPKSNRTALGIWTAREEVRKGATGRVPAALRDAHYQGAKGLGHGQGYEYPHDDPRGWVPQQHLPDEVADRTFYDPSPHGHEREIRQRMDRLRQQDPDS
ncbi:MAG TPA: replication-associated recombination protein A [Iamia sp.]